METLEVGLQKLSLQPGDVLLVQAGREFSEYQAERLKEMLADHLGFAVPIMVVSGRSQVKVVSEDEAKAVQVALALDTPIPPMLDLTGIYTREQLEVIRETLKAEVGVLQPCYG